MWGYFITCVFITSLIYTGHAVGLVEHVSCPITVNRPNTIVIHENKMMFRNTLTYCNFTAYIYSEYNHQRQIYEWVDKNPTRTVYQTTWGLYNENTILIYYLIHAMFLWIILGVSISVYLCTHQDHERRYLKKTQ
jgi:hypothetical protein